MVKYLRLDNDNDEIVQYDDSRICGKYDGEGYEYPEGYVKCWATHYKEYGVKILNDKEIDIVHYEWSDYEERMIRHQYICGIVAQADSLDKLCESFIYLDVSFGRVVHRREDTLSCLCERHNIINDTEMPYNQFKHFEEDEDFIQLDETHWLDKEKVDRGVYGAIWTEDGLIYRAKMNYSGKLVLL